MRLLSVSSAVAFALLLLPSTVKVQDAVQQAQTPLGAPADDANRDWSQDVPAHFTVVDGQVMLERDARLEPAEPNQIVMAGDRLRTSTGRTEILFPDGTTLSVDEDSELDFLSDSLLRLRDGAVRMNIVRATDKLDYRIDAAPGHVEIRAAGDYRVSLGTDQRNKPEIDLTVFRGSADLVNDNGRTTVRAGKHAVTSADLEPSEAYTFNSASQDEFSEWVEKQRDSHVVSTSSQSAQYLPPDSQYYASTMDTYGTWGYQEPYGAVWYPSVSVGWYPYWQGRWGYSNHYHWTWIGIDHWAWPTYHYGYWGVGSAGWYWVPGYAYAPAWVTWGYAPGYVGWCPVGPYGKPVGAWGWNDPYHHGGPWTVVPSHSMGHNMWASENALRPDAMPLNARSQFAQQRGGPVPAGSALPRANMGSISSPTRPRDVAGARTNLNSNVGLSPRGATNDVAGALSGFPATNGMTRMPDAIPRATMSSPSAGVGTSAAVRAVPRGVVRDDARDVSRDSAVRNVSPGTSGFPSTRSTSSGFPEANRSVPRAEVPGGDARVSRGRADGFPSATVAAPRAVPRGLDGPSNTPTIIRGEPGTVSSSMPNRGYSSGYRSVPSNPQTPTVERGRAVPRNDGPPTNSLSQPVMAAPERRAPVVSAPPPSPSMGEGRGPAGPAVPRGQSMSPAARPASPPAAPPSRGGGAGQAQGSATARGRGRG